jgi:hypothetical protein
MRIERFIYSVLIIGASLIAGLYWRKAALFQADNEEMRLRLESLQTEAEGASRLLEVNRENAQKLRTQTSELMRLRDEVTQLRSDSKSTVAVLAENEKLKTQLAEARKASGAATVPGDAMEARLDDFPRERWSFAGYGTPEDAMVSAIWAMTAGDRARYLESLTPQEQERMLEVWSANEGGISVEEKHRNLTAGISNLKIVERQNVSPTEMVMNVFLQSGAEGRFEKIRMTQVGAEWKFGGFIREHSEAQIPPGNQSGNQP